MADPLAADLPQISLSYAHPRLRIGVVGII
jgi:hypothetical protein